MRQDQRCTVPGVFLLHGRNGGACRGVARHVAEHVGERGLLAAEQQQRQQQGEEGIPEAAHEARIRTQCATSINLQQQTLQVVAFRKRQVDRMIGGALQALHDARPHSGRCARVERGAGDDLLEQLRADAAGT